MFKFQIPINPVTKKNSSNIIPIKTKTGKIRHIPLPSKQYKEFEKACLPFLTKIKNEVGNVNSPVNVKCLFFVKRKNRYDLTNLLEAIDDTMVKSGLILDDNRDIIAGHDGSRVYHDKFNPRIEIEIANMQDYTQWNYTQSVQQKLI